MVPDTFFFDKIDKPLYNLIKAIFDESRATYGTRRLKAVLVKRYGLIVSRRKIQKALSYMNLKVKMKRRFKVITTTSNHKLPTAPNHLNRAFNSSYINLTYVADITYIPTKEGWLYLAVVIDIFSRKVIGWSMSHLMHTELVNKALLMTIKRRSPKAGVIYHSDRGSQYASYEHRDILKCKMVPDTFF